MGQEKNQELLRYFHDRHVWMLEVDRKAPMKLSPYQDSVPSN
jgi:hypothetical protein